MNSSHAQPIATNDRYISHPFPLKLHDMLEYSHDNGLDHIVSWQPDGGGFSVRDSEAFAAIIIHRFFRQSRYKSFLRQLHIYGFKRVRKGINKGAYEHPLFARGQRNLSRRMIRRIRKQCDATFSSIGDLFGKRNMAPRIASNDGILSSNQTINSESGLAREETFPGQSLKNSDLKPSVFRIRESDPEDELIQPVDPCSIFGD